MFLKSKIFATLTTAALIFAAATAIFADTIKLKDGSVIKGKIVDFKNQQITIVRTGTNNRTTTLQIDADDIETVEFDSFANLAALLNNSPRVDNQNRTANNAPNDRANNGDNSGAQTTAAPSAQTAAQNSTPNNRSATTNQSSTQNTAPTLNPDSGERNGGGLSQVINSQPVQPLSNRANAKFVPPISVKVLADSTANGWTNTGLVVKKGQRLRISANGRISIGRGQYATPAGLGSVSDGDRLMKTEPTGALIAVIGDDNNDFVFVGARREFVAQRDGTLFLGVNEGDLNDNSGAFDAVVEAEAPDATAQR